MSGGRRGNGAPAPLASLPAPLGAVAAPHTCAALSEHRGRAVRVTRALTDGPSAEETSPAFTPHPSCELRARSATLSPCLRAKAEGFVCAKWGPALDFAQGPVSLCCLTTFPNV